MNFKYLIIQNTLFIKRPSFFKNISYKLILLAPLVIVFSLNIWFNFFNIAFDIFSVVFLFYIILARAMVKPSIFKDIKITKFVDKITVNDKIIPLDNILFLSFREADDYKYVRLESKRKHLIIANEILLYNECSSYDEALEFCRITRILLVLTLLSITNQWAGEIMTT